MNGLCSNVMQSCVIKDEEKMKNRLKKLIFKILSTAWYIRTCFRITQKAKACFKGSRLKLASWCYLLRESSALYRSWSSRIPIASFISGS